MRAIRSTHLCDDAAMIDEANGDVAGDIVLLRKDRHAVTRLTAGRNPIERRSTPIHRTPAEWRPMRPTSAIINVDAGRGQQSLLGAAELAATHATLAAARLQSCGRNVVGCIAGWADDEHWQIDFAAAFQHY